MHETVIHINNHKSSNIGSLGAIHQNLGQDSGTLINGASLVRKVHVKERDTKPCGINYMDSYESGIISFFFFEV